MIYRRLLRLYPREFLRTFGDELEMDFEQESREARAGGGVPALVGFWMRAGVDLARSLVREWLRTPWIPVLIAAGAVTFAIFATVASKVGQWQQYRYWPAHRAIESDADTLMIELLVIGALIPIVGTILGSLWMLLLRRSMASRHRRRV